jgi:hypothetical protein
LEALGSPWKPMEAHGSPLEAIISFGSPWKCIEAHWKPIGSPWKPGEILFIFNIENFLYITPIIYYVLINKIQGLVRRLGIMTAVGASIGYDGFGVGNLFI